MKNKLLPCPCCRSSARIFGAGKNFEEKRLFYAGCKKDKCGMRTKSCLIKDDAANIWNTRAIEVTTKMTVKA